MQERVFIWVAHPGEGTFNHALADAYEQGARSSGAKVRRMDLANMAFSTDFTGYADAPALEQDLLAWQENLAWATRVFIVHPLWWGAMPALAKTVLDRGLTSGFAYKYRKGPGIKWDKLLDGRVGDAIITADTPRWIDNWLYLRPARRILKDQVLGFCGIKPRKIKYAGSVKLSDEAQREKWLAQAFAMGAKKGTNLRPATDFVAPASTDIAQLKIAA
ncbi:NAD(P)H-dependent oxidoreductase [Altererythrobacter lutimaris]|uniref:NAD(P)H-dependent oxidoreductase n=1 Tax=Altererythrobacter lutimaris TaxID=2743979 RepID=A0A850HHU3_9SPHN|nr:NAD(P)H-dependent oxidoreductase [Altererythrobacter lutimaris]NVE94822.1 NAD(P)H-dependent oxidoreductase [Altererythrobacter lutimaris]